MNRYFEFWGLPGKFNLSILLLLYSFLMAILFPTTDHLLCALAMLLSSLGDITLMNFKNLKEKLPCDHFILGAAFFMLAHVAYQIAFFLLIKQRNFSIINPGFFVAVGIVLATFVVITILIFRKNKRIFSKMYLVCTIYMIFIGINCAIIFSFAYSISSFKSIAALGALSFFISDVLIGTEKLLSVKSKVVRELIWWFYPIGQFILLSCG